MQAPIGVAVVGCGGISKVHLKAINENPRVVLRAVCDIREERAQAAAQAYGVPYYTDYREMLSNPDVQSVHICTPHALHAPMALEALARGKWVLTEKPMAGSVEDARTMIAKADGRLGVVFQNRYNDSVQHLKTLLESGEAGKIRATRAVVCWNREAPYYTESGWRGKWSSECGGSLINQALHTVDLMQWLCGPVEAVRGSVTTDLLEGIIEVEDNTHAVLKLKDGVIGLLHTSNNYPLDAPIELEIVCERATYRLYGDSLLRMEPGRPIEVLCQPDAAKAPGKSYWGNSHSRLIDDFYTAVAENRPFWLDGKEGLPALWVVRSIYASSAGQGWVRWEE